MVKVEHVYPHLMRAALLPTILLCIVIGAAIGVGSFTFVYAEGASYLVDDPQACANCHVMEEQYSAWIKSSHRAVATCNSCHTEHQTIPKYITKAINGFNHSLAFTTGNYDEHMRITERNRRITEQACRTCHEGVVAAMVGIPHPVQPVTPSDDSAGRGDQKRAAEAHAGATISCIRCHQNVGHWTH